MRVALPARVCGASAASQLNEEDKEMKKLTLFRSSMLLMVVLIAAAAAAMAQNKDFDDTLTSLGYKITWKITAAGADWELRDFNMRVKRVFAIRSRKKVPGEKNMYYRYSVQIEEYASEADAQKRIDHIAATPPGPDRKMVGPEHGLRVGFRRGTLVYVVSTDVYKFVVAGSLNEFRRQLEEKIPAE